MPQARRRAAPEGVVTKQREKKPDPYSIILLAALLGALAGGTWLGLALAVLSGPARSLFDLAAGLLSSSLLAAVARLLANHHGRRTLRLFSALTVLSTLISYITH